MKNDQLPSSGESDELLDSGVNEFDEENEDENFDNDNEDENDNDGNEDDDSWKGDKVNRKQKYHSFRTVANQRLKQLEKDLEMANTAKDDDLSDEDLAKLQEKYDEQDINIIKKLIKKEARNLMDKDKSSSLQKKELTVFFKKHPDITEPELKHVQDLQEKYGYSLEKAYSVLFWKSSTEDKKPNRSVNNFGWDSKSWQKSKDNGDDDAYKDMITNYT